MPAQFSGKGFLVFLFLLVLLFTFIQIGAISIVFDKLGLSYRSAMMLLFASLFGSVINLPLFRIQATGETQIQIPWYLRSWLHQPIPFTGKTLIALNVGGGLIPVLFSFYLIEIHQLSVGLSLAAIGIVALVSYLVSRPVQGLGIGMPILVAPLTAALSAVLLQPQLSAPLAYVGGTLGVLVGADLLRLKDIRRMGVPVASIGGAGTFDGIFITGIVAVLLA